MSKYIITTWVGKFHDCCEHCKDNQYVHHTCPITESGEK